MTQALVLQLHLDSVIARANGQSSNRSLPLLLPGRGAETAFSMKFGPWGFLVCAGSSGPAFALTHWHMC